MTFTEIKTEIMDRLNLSSTEAGVRVGRSINRKYRLVTTSIGMQLSRRTTITQSVTPGVATLIFTNTEKVINVVNRTSTPYRILTELTIDEFEANQPYASSDSPTKYAVLSHTADTVTIILNKFPATAYTLYADVHQVVADLSGTVEPAFPESFHDILIEGVMSDELRKMEKPQLAQIAQTEYERILSDLRMWIAKNGYLDIYPSKDQNSFTNLGYSVGAGSSSAAYAPLATTYSGYYTPIFTVAGGSNIDSVSINALSAQYLRVGSVVTVSGRMTINPTAASSTLTSFSMSLPISSDFGDSSNLAGIIMQTSNAPFASGGIEGDSANNVAVVAFGALSANANNYVFHFTYRVI